MSASARIVAQAKINLLLRVLAQEKSGYHSIETVFQRIDLGDEIVVRATDSGRALDCTGPAVPAGGLGEPHTNLAFRAAELYRRTTGWPGGFSIELDKRIPVGSGLGGGSADAGAVLRALDSLAPRPLGPRLVELGSTLGADVPFLTTTCTLALAWGRGERMLSLPPLPARTVAVVAPDVAVSTAEAYGWLAAERGEYAPRARLLSPEVLRSWESVATVASNDFERIVSERHPVVNEIIRGLRDRGSTVSLMSGSGSSVFGIFAWPLDPRTLRLPSGCAVLETRTSERVADVQRLQ